MMEYLQLIVTQCLLWFNTVPLVPISSQQSPSPGSWNVTIPYADWNQVAKAELDAALARQPKICRAKNVILFIGDGMGASTVTGARMLKAQKEKKNPHEAKLAWDNFPSTGLAKTYNADVYTGDSAATATAYMCGEKARQGTVGVNDQVERFKCDKYGGNQLMSMIEHAVEKGKWGGIVTNTRLTHGSPAGAYASTPDREWEAIVSDECKDKVKDVAHQLIYGEQSRHFRVLLGGGRQYFMPENETDVEYQNIHGLRTDGINLIEEWAKLKKDAGVPTSHLKYVTKQSEFDAVDPDSTEYLLGMFEPSYMRYEVKRRDDPSGEPSVEEMTAKAISILQRSHEGYFLFVEGGLIDKAHHANWARRALEETLMMEKAVAKAAEMTDADDTLIIVSGDHSHVFNIGADSMVGNDIFGWVVNQFGQTLYAEDNKPEMLLKYANGPGWKVHRSLSNDFKNEKNRMDLTDQLDTGKTGSDDFIYDGPEPRLDDSHGAEDVPIYARGPMAHLLSGTHEQMYIAHISMYAACVGPYQSGDHCSASYGSPNTACPLIKSIFGVISVIIIHYV